MSESIALSHVEALEQPILLIRGEKVMVDTDLARFYAVSTKRLNGQVKRNADRFPGDFVFQLTRDEKVQVVAVCDPLSTLRSGGSVSGSNHEP